MPRKGPRRKGRDRAISAQETLPFAAISTDGIMMSGGGFFSKTLQLGDAGYRLAGQEERERIFGGWCSLLNRLDPGTSVDLTCISRPRDRADRTGIPQGMPDSGGEGLPSEYARMAERRAMGSETVRERFLTFCVRAEGEDAARGRLERIADDASAELRAIGVASQEVGGGDLMRILARQCGGGPDIPGWGDMRAAGLAARDVVAPEEFDFGHAGWYRAGRAVHRCGHLQITAPELSDELLTDMLGTGAPCTVTVHLEPMDQASSRKLLKAKATDLAKMKIDEQKKAVRSGYDMDILPPDLVTYSNEAERLIRELESRNERLFDACVTVDASAPTLRGLDSAAFGIDGAAQSHNCKVRPLSYQQEAGFRTTMLTGRRQLPMSRVLTTSAAAALLPFFEAEIDPAGQPVLYGTDLLSGDVLLADRRALKNPNGLILGIPGGGKSFAAKAEAAGVLFCTGDDIVVCDPEGEYGAFVRALGGTVVEVSPTSDSHINPMDINPDYSDDDSPLALKSDFILSMVELVMGAREGLTAEERSVIDRCLPQVYAAYLADPAPERMPVLGDLHAALYRQPEPAAARIATALEIYVSGSLSAFNHRTDVDLSSRIVCFDVRDLGKQLKKLGMLVVQDQVWNRVTANRGARRATRYYVDEFHLLLREEQTAAYMVEIWKRFRKWGGIPTGITQNVKDLLASREIENILDNSDFVMMLSQAPGDRAILEGHLGMSEAQQRYVTNAGPGEGLLFFGDAIVPFENRFDAGSRLYALMTTKPEEAIGREA